MIWTALELGETQLLLGQRSPRAALELAERYGASVSHCAASRPDWEKELSAHPVQFRLATDGLYFALCALSCLTENALTLPVWLSTMPKVCRTERTLPLKDDSRGEALRRIAEMEPAAQVDGGVCIQRENAVAWIAPDDTRPECRIITESRGHGNRPGAVRFLRRPAEAGVGKKINNFRKRPPAEFCRRS